MAYLLVMDELECKERGLGSASDRVVELHITIPKLIGERRSAATGSGRVVLNGATVRTVGEG